MAGHYLVEQGKGPGWDHAKPRREQRGWDAHAAFMDALADDGLIVLGGPIGEGDGENTLLIFKAATETEVRDTLHRDPWFEDVLTVVSVRPWSVWVRAPAQRGA
jgi:uncharacterized protein YciI